jgi:hypothetical protein
MIICPWCGTNYTEFQPNCSNCGGPLQAAEESRSSAASPESVPVPPPAPRPISNNYAWKLLTGDGWAISAFILGLLGGIFSLVGIGLTVAVVTAFVGIPFLLLGLLLLAVGVGLIIWRYGKGRRVVEVLRTGQAATGSITEVRQNYSVVVNGRSPWVIGYSFTLDGREYMGKVSTLNQIGEDFHTGEHVCILYLPSAPEWNSIYPHV